MSIVCITGASSGIGRAAAEVFAENNHSLIIAARRFDRLEILADELVKKGAKEVHCASLDVTNESSCQAFYESVTEKYPNGIDVLLNNAGLAAGKDPVANAKFVDWERMIDTNIYGVLRLTQKFLPRLIEKKSGHIINIGSIAGREPYEGGSVYCGTKFALRAITKALRLELCGTNIRVSSIDPGMVNTEFSLVRLGDQEKSDAVYKGLTPLGARDVAECIYFAASRPPHVNIDEILVMSTDQASATKAHRRK